MLLTDVEGKKYTIEEYKTLITSEQTDKDGNLVILYADNKDALYSHIQRAKDKGYSVLLMDGPLDVHAVGQLEQKLEKTRFVRVDSDSISRIIVKEDAASVSLSAEEQTKLTHIFTGRLPEEEKKNYHVQIESLGEQADAVLITQGEWMRRMQEMARMQPGMSFYGEMPESFNVVLNADHPLVKRVLSEEGAALEGELASLRSELKAQTEAVETARKAQEGKQEEEISTADKEALDNLAHKQAELEGKITAELKAYGAGNDLVGQLIDLALLGSGLLTGEALAKFIQRSQSLLIK